jgi:hypothetical protein
MKNTFGKKPLFVDIVYHTDPMKKPNCIAKIVDLFSASLFLMIRFYSFTYVIMLRMVIFTLQQGICMIPYGNTF